MKVRFTALAMEQLATIVDALAEANELAAKRFGAKAHRAIQRLETFPESGRSVPEFPGSKYREVIIVPYRFFYRIEGETVWIVAIWHGARLPHLPEEV